MHTEIIEAIFKPFSTNHFMINKNKYGQICELQHYERFEMYVQNFHYVLCKLKNISMIELILWAFGA
jgi:hypothetical protein